MGTLLPAAPGTIHQPQHTRSGRSEVDAATLITSAIFFTAFAGQAWRNLVDWQGFAVVTIILAVAAAAFLIPRITRHQLAELPIPLLAFLAFSAISIAWSHYRGASFLGIGAQWLTAAIGIVITLTMNWKRILDALAHALTGILGLSFIFELFVTFVVRAPLLPLTMSPGEKPGSFYWSNDLLAHGGPIQGIVGNRNLLAFIALLAIIVLVVRYLERRATAVWTVGWLIIAFVTIIFTDSATVILALFALGIVTGLIITVRNSGPRLRNWLYPGGAAALLGVVAFAVIHSATIFSLVGRDEDMSGRLQIWRTVSQLAIQDPILGWGWVSYWAPWVQPFKDLVIIDDTPYLQAHNALLDIWMQLGVVGVILALTVAIMATVRAWRIAVSPVDHDGCPQPYRAITVLPVLLLGALLIQSLTESRLLIEGNWLLFVICAVHVKLFTPPHESSTTQWSA
jgi:exopolysaccharide production protein ExoQ